MVRILVSCLQRFLDDPDLQHQISCQLVGLLYGGNHSTPLKHLRNEEYTLVVKQIAIVEYVGLELCLENCTAATVVPCYVDFEGGPVSTSCRSILVFEMSQKGLNKNVALMFMTVAQCQNY